MSGKPVTEADVQALECEVGQRRHRIWVRPPDAVKCERCGKPLNRWAERCDYQLTSAHLLAEDVLWLLDQLEASRAA